LQDYVWYASYGSNLNKERFLCYIKGGQPEGSLDIEPGCKNSELPNEDKSVVIPHELIFTKNARRWGNGGVAFIGAASKEEKTLGRMYLITREQFLDVVSQENGNISVNIDLDEVIQKKNVQFDQSWYGNVVYLGMESGWPIFTFTQNWEEEDHTYIAPSTAYLKTIIRGIMQCFQLSDEEIVSYFEKKKGIRGNFSRQQLLDIVISCKE
jgi:hypothetical protein